VNKNGTKVAKVGFVDWKRPHFRPTLGSARRAPPRQSLIGILNTAIGASDIAIRICCVVIGSLSGKDIAKNCQSLADQLVAVEEATFRPYLFQRS
jgi:hypothetical protein